MLRATTNTLVRSAQRQQQLVRTAVSASVTQVRTFASDANHEIKEPTREEEAEVEPFRKKINELKKYNPPIKVGKKGISIVRA